jgi:hypothetical protein
MRRISFLGVIVGGVVDIASSSIAGITLGIVLVMLHPVAHQSAEQIRATLQNSPALFWSGEVVGLLGSVLGGYVAALLAKHDELLNGALSSWLCIGIGLVSLAGVFAGGDVLQTLFAIAVSPLAAMAGGLLRRRQTARR